MFDTSLNYEINSVLSVKALEERVVDIGLYSVVDNDSEATSPVPLPANLVAELNDIFGQACVRFNLMHTTNGPYQLPYDSTYPVLPPHNDFNYTPWDGEYDAAEKSLFAPFFRTNQGVRFFGKWNGILVRKSGLAYGNYRTSATTESEKDGTWPPALATNANFHQIIFKIRGHMEENGGIVFTTDTAGWVERALAHEFGHEALIKALISGNGHDWAEDRFPVGEAALMRSGAPIWKGPAFPPEIIESYYLPVPGRWIKHEWWDPLNIGSGMIQDAP